MHKYPFITIIGNVATGKSTLAPILAKSLKAKHIKADELFKTNPFFSDALMDRTRWSLASDLWFLVKRVELAKTIEKTIAQKPIVQDSGLLMSWVYATSRISSGFMTPDEFALYKTTYDKLTYDLPRETLIIYLDVPIQVLLKRIRKRGREYEIRFFTPRYLASLASSLQQVINHVRRHSIPVLTIKNRNEQNIKKQRDQVIALIQEKLISYGTILDN